MNFILLECLSVYVLLLKGSLLWNIGKFSTVKFLLGFLLLLQQIPVLKLKGDPETTSHMEH